MIRLAGLLLGLALVSANHAEDLRQAAFADYPATTHQRGKAVKPILRTAQDKQYQTRIGEAASDGKVNFAGHYMLSAIGCGAGCVMVFALDADTGKVSWLPFTVSQDMADQGFDTDIPPLDFRPDSRLLMIAGSRNERGHGLYQYVFEHDQFRLLNSREDSPGGSGK
jgi:hypothetical protein